MNNIDNQIEKLSEILKDTNSVVVGAGAGLSTSAGFTYSGNRFELYFDDFIKKYGFKDMYTAGFYDFHSEEEFWAYWSRHIYYNRFVPTPKPTYDLLLKIVQNKDYFVITTNVDHRFQASGFDKQRLFYTQGDYGLFQCATPCHKKTYDNKEIIQKMIAEQRDMKIPTELVPRCPVCGGRMDVNLRKDSTFVEDEGWDAAALRYKNFIQKHSAGKIVFMDLGIGANTPAIIKYPFMRMTYQNPDATYVTINLGEAFTIKEIENRSICINADINDVFEKLIQKMNQ